MYDIPLAIVFGVRGAFFVLGFLAMAFCPWRFVPKALSRYSNYGKAKS